MVPDEDNEQGYRSISDPRDLGPDEMRKYWNRVQKTLTDVFKISDREAAKAVGELQERLHKTEPDAQLHFYHADPFQVAADTARPGGEVTPEEKDRYLEVLKREEQDQHDWPSSGSLRRALPDDPPPKD
ncbi:MAG TPA: hypothetical protein VEI03_11575 [Stellaceae bacterium]|nr:hypothetical protein [Stellaceae bacterium]